METTSHTRAGILRRGGHAARDPCLRRFLAGRALPIFGPRRLLGTRGAPDPSARAAPDTLLNVNVPNLPRRRSAVTRSPGRGAASTADTVIARRISRQTDYWIGGAAPTWVRSGGTDFER